MLCCVPIKIERFSSQSEFKFSCKHGKNMCNTQFNPFIMLLYLLWPLQSCNPSSVALSLASRQYSIDRCDGKHGVKVENRFSYFYFMCHNIWVSVFIFVCYLHLIPFRSIPLYRFFIYFYYCIFDFISVASRLMLLPVRFALRTEHTHLSNSMR